MIECKCQQQAPIGEGTAVADTKVPLYQLLERQLREDIGAGRLVPGDRLPSEPELARSHGMARMTARRAVEGLVHDGLVIRRRGRGTFVSEPRLSYPAASFISFSRTMNALGHTVITSLLNFELIGAEREIAEGLQIPEGTPILLVRRLRNVDGEPVAIHASFMDASFLDALRASDLLVKPISDAMERATGVRVTSSRDYLEGSTASIGEAELLRIEVGSPVQIVSGVAYSEDRRPVLATRAWYRADRFRFAIGMSGPGLPFEMSGRDTQ